MKGKCAIKQTVVGRKREEQAAVHTLARLYAAEKLSLYFTKPTCACNKAINGRQSSGSKRNSMKISKIPTLEIFLPDIRATSSCN
uniref:Uncharacterized protein n=1 Tax=Salix viminalis TaxID=40686 RepID=A0A6N2MDL5_SALVM